MSEILILLIDPDVDSYALIEQFELDEEKVEVVHCDYPEEALDLFETSSFSLVVTEMAFHDEGAALDEEGGVELIQYVNENFPEVVVVIYSGLESSAVHKTIKDNGLSAHLVSGGDDLKEVFKEDVYS